MTRTDTPFNKRLILSLLVLAVCIIGISLIWLNVARPSSSVADSVSQEHHDPRLQIDKLLDLANRNRELARAAVQYNPSNSEAQFITEPFSSLRPQLERNLQELNEITTAYSASAVTDQERLLLNTVVTDLQALTEKGLKPVFEAAESNRFEDAIHLYYRELEPAFSQYRKSIDLLKRLHPEAVVQG